MAEAYSQQTQLVLAHLDQFTEEELVHLNRVIVERLRLMRQVQAHHAMTQFRVGQRVKFINTAGQTKVGVLTRYNRKSVTIITDQGEHWNVSPALLSVVN